MVYCTVKVATQFSAAMSISNFEPTLTGCESEATSDYREGYKLGFIVA